MIYNLQYPIWWSQATRLKAIAIRLEAIAIRVELWIGDIEL